jgi:hypothetical protein
MSAIDVEQDAGSGLRSEQGVAPVSQQTPTDGGEAIFGAAFRQTNTVVSAIQAMRNSGNFAPVPGYNPVDDIKAWKEPNYFLEHGDNFVGSQSPAETQSIKAQIDTETTDRRTLAANGKIGFVASTVAGMTDPTMLLPGGVAIDATKGGLSFTKAAVQLGKAGLMQTVAQEALLHASQETRTAEESALNIASGTLLTALIGGGAASLLRPAERVALERALHADRAEINTHAENPSTGEARPVSVPDENANPEIISKAATDFQEMGPGSNRSVDRERAIQQQLGDAAAQQYRSEFDRLTNEAVAARMAERTSGTGVAAAAGAAASDTRQVELVNFGLNQVPGLRTVVEKTSPMQRLFGAAGVTVRRTIADLAETSLLTKENLEGKVTTAGPAVDRQARLMINQGQVAVGDELTKLFSEYRYGEQRALVRQRSTIEDMTGRAEPGKMSFDDFKQAVTEAARNGDTHDIPQVQMAAQTIRNKVFEPWKKRAIEAGLLGENVDVKTADSYVQRLYNKQAIAAKRPEFVNRVADWLAADQSAKAEAQTRIEGLSKRISDAETNIEFFTKQLAKTGEDDLLRPGHEQDLSRAIENHRTARRQLETEIASWEGKSVSEAKAALKVREEAEQARAEKQSAGAYKGKGERLSSADKAIDKAVKRILKSDRDLSRQELESRAQEITDRIIGSPDGRLPYDLGHGARAGGGGDATRPAGSREFNIPDKTIADFLENDIEHIVCHASADHGAGRAADREVRRHADDRGISQDQRRICGAIIDAAKSEKERTAARKGAAGRHPTSPRCAIASVASMACPQMRPFATLRGSLGVLKNYNVLTSMGSAALSSLPDMAGSVMRHGLTNDVQRRLAAVLQHS